MTATPIKTAFGQLIPGFSDTVNGQTITSSSLSLGTHAGECQVTHNGEKHTITIVHNLGASLTFNSKHRHFNVDVKTLIEHAIESGLLEPVIDFTE